ncbi:MAG: hypothetical protein CMA92_00790 [Euryarchaeota archaeon]|nr:hypothetical protein [Euryarchaeota archaeon]
MRVKILPILVTLTFVTVSLSGCLGLIQARESLENLRGEPTDIEYTEKTSVLYTFDNPENKMFNESFTVNEKVQRIEIYVKVKFNLDEFIPCFDGSPRYVRAEIIKPSGDPLWSMDVCEDYSPPNFNFNSSSTTFEYGTWDLNIDAQAFGETVGGLVKDEFIIIVNVYHKCRQYPQDSPCNE